MAVSGPYSLSASSFLPSKRKAAEVTCAAVNPNWFMTSCPEAEAPNRSMPIMVPSSPARRCQPKVGSGLDGHSPPDCLRHLTEASEAPLDAGHDWLVPLTRVWATQKLVGLLRKKRAFRARELQRMQTPSTRRASPSARWRSRRRTTGAAAEP